jgi:hypothetical protein
VIDRAERMVAGVKPELQGHFLKKGFEVTGRVM